MFTRRATGDRKIRSDRRTLRVSATGLFAAGLLSLFSCRRSCQDKRGQQVAEYMVLIAVLAAAFLTANVYARRGLQAHIKQAVDAEIGTQIAGSPLIVPGTEERSTGGGTSTSRSNTRVRRDGLTSRVDYDSSSLSSGIFVSTFNQES
jgi:hypothetical protein